MLESDWAGDCEELNNTGRLVVLYDAAKPVDASCVFFLYYAYHPGNEDTGRDILNE